VQARAEQLFAEIRDENYRRVDRLFAILMVVQWVAAIVVALTISPYGWEGKVKTTHVHVWVAVGLGGLVSSLPIALVLLRPGAFVTRVVVASAQMMWSALLIHLSGGRIETHFHVFGSLAFVAFYRDWRVLLPATVVVAADHLIRQMLWPESVYGILNPEWWRFMEHAFWVTFEDIVLIMACIVGMREMREVARRRAEAEALQEERVQRSEKLAAVGQLAASVGHELRNPLAAVRNAAAFVGRRLKDGEGADPKIPQFLGVMDRELGVCTKIISDLLEFAREQPPVLAPCPLRPLVQDAIELVPRRDATVVNDVPEDLPIPNLDKDQFRQVIVNLVQNAVEAMEGRGKVMVQARAVGGELRITVSDEGPGMERATLERIFEPLFTTKTKGTGLGLAIVQGVVRRHEGKIAVESEPGKGTVFHIDIAAPARAKAA
jgi:signal transduction histidine kinase